jgi:hypothetical protein
MGVRNKIDSSDGPLPPSGPPQYTYCDPSVAARWAAPHHPHHCGGYSAAVGSNTNCQSQAGRTTWCRSRCAGLRLLTPCLQMSGLPKFLERPAHSAECECLKWPREQASEAASLLGIPRSRDLLVDLARSSTSYMLPLLTPSARALDIQGAGGVAIERVAEPALASSIPDVRRVGGWSLTR